MAIHFWPLSGNALAHRCLAKRSKMTVNQGHMVVKTVIHDTVK